MIKLSPPPPPPNPSKIVGELSEIFFLARLKVTGMQDFKLHPVYFQI